MEIRKTKQSRLELGNAEAIMHGDGIFRRTFQFPQDEGYCVPSFMRDFIVRIGPKGDIEFSEEDPCFAPMKGKVVRFNYYSRSTTEYGAKPDLTLNFEEFTKLGRPLYILREETYRITRLKHFNVKL